MFSRRAMLRQFACGLRLLGLGPWRFRQYGESGIPVSELFPI
jgi:hypothetical protein